MDSKNRPFIPQKLPLPRLDLAAFQSYTGKAHANLGRLDTYLEILPSNEILSFSSLLTRESVSSSRIEGTQTSIEEFFIQGIDDQKPNPDHQEVLNYIEALKKGFELLKTLPICKRLITDTHKILMSGVRGKNKTPGLFRTGPVYIGAPAQGIAKANFVPPTAEHISDSFSNLENYINTEDHNEDFLVQLAIVHGQFEIIHPFFDGNGRIGRMLIPLFLYSKGIVKTVHIYVSEYLEENRDEYYHKLRSITEKGDWESWIIFFLQALTAQSEKNLNLLKEVHNLHRETLDCFNNVTTSKYSLRFIDLLFREPIIKSIRISAENSDIPIPSLHNHLNLFHKEGVLEKIKGGVRGSNVSYRFTKLLELLSL